MLFGLFLVRCACLCVAHVVLLCAFDIVPCFGWYLTFIVALVLVCCVCVYVYMCSYPLFLNLIFSSWNCCWCVIWPLLCLLFFVVWCCFCAWIYFVVLIEDAQCFLACSVLKFVFHCCSLVFVLNLCSLCVCRDLWFEFLVVVLVGWFSCCFVFVIIARIPCSLLLNLIFSYSILLFLLLVGFCVDIFSGYFDVWFEFLKCYWCACRPLLMLLVFVPWCCLLCLNLCWGLDDVHPSLLCVFILLCGLNYWLLFWCLGFLFVLVRHYCSCSLFFVHPFHFFVLASPSIIWKRMCCGPSEKSDYNKSDEPFIDLTERVPCAWMRSQGYTQHVRQKP